MPLGESIIGEGKTWLKTQHSNVAGHLGCFHVLALVNSVAVNSGIHMSFSILVSSGYLGVRLLGHMVFLFLVF